MSTLRGSFALAGALAGLALSAAPPARAVETGGEAYQAALIGAALRAKGLAREAAPEGKRIERIEVVANDLVLPEEPWPDFLNWFHATTREYVLRRELLLAVGDAWNEDLVLESARNLREYLFVAMARIIPCRGSRPDQVVLLVVAKDLWSLRLNSDFSFVGSALERLQFELSEHNLAGRNKRATIDLGMDLAAAYAGLQYRDPRVMGSTILSQAKTDVIWNRASGAAEGVVAGLAVDKPLYTLNTPWAWSLTADYRNDYYRYFLGGQIASVKSAATGESLPYVLKRDRLEAKASLTRSFGRAHKQNATFGYRAVLREYKLPTGGPAISAAGAADIGATILPFSERAGMFFGAYQYYRADFQQLLDIDTFALTEDFRMGPSFSAELRWAARAFGFNSAFLQATVGAGWSRYAGDDLLILSTSASTRNQAEAGVGTPWVSANWTLLASNVSPKFGFLRLHSQARLTRRSHDLDHGFDTLGGEGNLRGYPSGYLRGANSWSSNWELRTAPVLFASLYFGAAGFVDLGDANDSWSQIGLHASGGAGLRILLPQFNRSILRVDLGLPFEAIATGYTPAYFVIQYGQAF